MLGGVFKPGIKARRRVSLTALTIALGGSGEVETLLADKSFERFAGIANELFDRVGDGMSSIRRFGSPETFEQLFIAVYYGGSIEAAEEEEARDSYGYDKCYNTVSEYSLPPERRMKTTAPIG